MGRERKIKWVWLQEKASFVKDLVQKEVFGFKEW